MAYPINAPAGPIATPPVLGHDKVSSGRPVEARGCKANRTRLRRSGFYGENHGRGGARSQPGHAHRRREVMCIRQRRTVTDNWQVVKGDKAAQENLPKVMQDKLNSQKAKTTPNVAPNGSRSYSSMTTPTNGNTGMDVGLVDFQSASKVPTTPGLKFEMPSLPLPKDGHVKHRHDPIVDQVTNLLMRHGKKSVAERVGQPSTKHSL